MTVTKILEQTLSAGSTSVSFTDADIPNSLIRVYSSNSDLIPVSRILSGNTLTVTYEAQANAIDVAVEIVKAGLDIVDNLTSTDTDKALSAKQGKVLKDDLDTLSNTVDNLDIPDNITDLDDVNVSSIQDGQVLAWDEDEEKFKNVTPASGHAYTETEQAIGLWIDNKVLYEKTVKIDALPSTTYTLTSYAHNIANIDMICSWEGFLHFSSGSCQSMLSTQFSNNAIQTAGSIFTYIDKTNITVMVGTDRSSVSATVTIRYTKTS